jgi:hypothetical protein
MLITAAVISFHGWAVGKALHPNVFLAEVAVKAFGHSKIFFKKILIPLDK